jgi:hypothetical protein
MNVIKNAQPVLATVTRRVDVIENAHPGQLNVMENAQPDLTNKTDLVNVIKNVPPGLSTLTH